MPESECVSEFVHGLFEGAGEKQVRIGFKSVKFLTKTMQGDERASAVQLSLTENERQDRNKQVVLSDANETQASLSGRERHKVLQNRRRMVLISQRVTGRFGIEADVADVAGDGEGARQRGRQIIKKAERDIVPHR